MRVTREYRIGNRISELHEIFIFGNEIRFGINLDDRCIIAVDCDGNPAVRCDPTGFLVGFRLTGLSQQLHRVLDVATGLDQGFLTFHHSGAGSIPKFLYHRCTD